MSNSKQQDCTITREVRITMLQALKRGYFDDEEIKQMQKFLFPNSEPVIIEVIDKREQVRN